ELARLLEQLSQVGSELLQALGALPGLRDKLLQFRVSPDGQAQAK
ncbi:MAG: hypothetical protein RL385_5672, partial [Pseudomonadota bacterium]